MGRIDTFISILRWIIIGGVAGYVSSLVLKAERQGCLIKVVIGIVGAFIGGFVMNFLLPGGLTGWVFMDEIINATVGAVILLVILEILLPGKQLGVDNGNGGRRRRR